MLVQPFNFGVWVSIALAGLAHAHIAPFHPAMYCFNGTDPSANPLNNNAPVQPLYNLPYSEFWFHHSNGCDEFPPDAGVFLELEAGGTLTMELAGNRADTSYNPLAVLTPWGDGENHPDDYTGNPCIFSPNLHTQNQSMAAGTAFAISYESEISKVTPDNLVVFTVRYNTPWKRITTYDIPSGMPACPDAGCLCTFLWIPNGCGQPNMYMFPYRCKVIPDSTPAKTIGTPKPAVWCEDDPSKCVQGPKQMLIWNQLDSNNIEVEGFDLSGEHKTPVYNAKCGFKDGVQNDIFVNPSTLAVSTPATGSGTLALPASTPASSLPAGSGTPTDSNLPAGSSTPALSASTPASNPPAGSATSTDPNLPVGSGTLTDSNLPAGSATPTSSNLPAGSGTPVLSASTLASNPPAGSGTPTDSNLPTGSGTPTDPNQPAWSGTPTGSSRCNDTIHETASAHHGSHSRRMMRREKRGTH